VSETDWSDLDVTELLPTGTVTLMLADVEGSTQLWESQPSAMTAAVEHLNRTASKLIAEHGGVRPVEQGEGDSFVAAFARASDAVACALALQRAPLAPIKLRIGLHTGEVQLRDEGNYAGSTINRTARLRDLAHGGQTVLSGTTEELVEDRLPDDSWLTDLGSHLLRDLPRPMRVAQLCHPDVRNDFPPLRVPKASATQRLPTQLTTFIGRRAQMNEIRHILAENRFVTLTGAGGAGKTRLAIEVAGQVTERYPDGVFYVDLAPITHPEVVPVTVARALGLPDLAGRSITETLLRFIRDRTMLIVLDNCEHLLEAGAELVTAMLASCSRMTLIATSREPLLVPGEVSWGVPSLSLTDEAIELFSDRARRARTDFRVTKENLEKVTEICRRLDGMPLAIELAAARVRALSLDEIVSSLHDRFRLLTGGARTAVRRQQTLRASVDWSHALLSQSERMLFRRLAVFMGGFDLAAAEAVSDDVQRYEVLDQLSLLVDKSLVMAENIGGSTRYRLLETVRQYALEKLGESSEASKVRTSHRDHYTTTAARLESPAQNEYERLIEIADREIDNLRAAFVWSLENSDLAEAVNIATSLQPLWLARGRVLEGLAWIDASKTAKPEPAPLVNAKAIADKAILGSWVDVTGNFEQASNALAIVRDSGDSALLVRILTACAFSVAHDPKTAEPYFAEAIALARAVGDSWRLSQLLSRQAYGAFMAGDLNSLASVATEGRDVADAIGDRFNFRQCQWVLLNLGICRGELNEMLASLPDYIADATAAHDRMSAVIGLMFQVYAAAHVGDATVARAAAKKLIESSAELAGMFDNGAYSAVAMAYLADGDVSAAWEAAQTARRRSMNPPAESMNAVWLTQVAVACGELTAAQRWAEEAVSGTRGWFSAWAMTARGQLHVAAGDFEEAVADARRALAIAARVEGKLLVPEMLETLARSAQRPEDYPEAARLLGAADAMRRRLGMMRIKAFDAAHNASAAQLRTAMGDTDYDTAWAEGAALSPDEAVAYALRGRGERKRPSSGWDSLTPTELDVVRLVGEGLANKDVAARLFVSPRTVQSHLRHVYNKVGLTSRVQLAQEAVRRNRIPGRLSGEVTTGNSVSGD
jgi:predicted ATPase/class 3 adenylate cyclase/DNA-binding CsgD family transcriptional regulator